MTDIDYNDRLHKVYYEIAQQLSESEEKSLRYLLSSDKTLTEGLEKVKNTVDLFHFLEEEKKISIGNLSLLKELLQTIHREHLVQLLEEEEAKESCRNRPIGGTNKQQFTSTDIVLECEERLKSHYSNLSHILPFPWWDGTNRLKLENVYTELELQTKDGTKRDFPTREIFSSEHDKDSKRVLIEGDQGYGKSIFCKKLAYDWAKGIVDYLNCFKLLFCFKLKDLLEYDSKNFQDAFFNQLSWDVRDEGKRQKLWNYIKDNQLKTCFVFDGLDEVSTEDLPTYFSNMVDFKKRLLPKCLVIVTSRKVRDKNSKQMYSTQLLIKGFDRYKAKAFVEKHINAMNSTGELQTEAKASDFLKEVDMSCHKNVLFDFMQSPLYTLMLCHIWIQENKLPNTLTKLYEEIVDIVVKSYKENHECICNEEIKQALLLLGKMSLKGLTTCERKVYFNGEDVFGNKHLFKLGLLTKISGLPARYGFNHLTFQEYFASLYLADLSTDNGAEFKDEISIITKEKNRGDYDTLFAFLGGMLKDNVGQIFRVWQEKCFGNIKFDLRPMLYESCCTLTDVFECCAGFLPEHFTIDLDSMVHSVYTNNINVNIGLLKCPEIRSNCVEFTLSAPNADTLHIAQQCVDALQNNERSFGAVTLTIGDYVHPSHMYYGRSRLCDRYKNYCGLPSKTKPVKANCILLAAPDNMKSPTTGYQFISSIVQTLSQISSNYLFGKDIPLETLESIQNVDGWLSSENIQRKADVTFRQHNVGQRNFAYERNETLTIKAEFGHIKTCYHMDAVNFDASRLLHLISRRASLERKLVTICCSFERMRLGHEQRNNYFSRISTMIKDLSNVFADKLSLQNVPLGNLDFITNIHDCLNRSNKRLQSVDLTFCGNETYDSGKRYKLVIREEFGYRETFYMMNEMKFDLLGLHKFHSKFASIDSERVIRDVTVCIDLFDIKDTLRLFKTLEVIDIREIKLDISTTYRYIMADAENYPRVCSILNILSNISADKLVMNLPIGNVDFIKNVHKCLVTNKQLKSASVGLGRDVEFWSHDGKRQPDHKLTIRSQFGNYKIGCEINDVNFDLVGLHECLSKLASVDNERVLRAIMICIDIKDIEEGDGVIDLFRRLNSIDMRDVFVYITNSRNCNEEAVCSRISCIVKSLSKIPADKLVIKGLTLGNLDFIKNVHDSLASNKLLKSVDLTFREVSKDESKVSLKITGQSGNCKGYYYIENINFDFFGLQNCLSKHASVDNEWVFRDIEINTTIKTIMAGNDVMDLFERLKLIGVKEILLYIVHKTVKDIVFDKSICHEEINYERICCILNSLSKVSVDELVIKELPLGNLDFIKNVHGFLNSNKQLKSVDVTFCEWSNDNFKRDIKIKAQIGRYRTCYKMNDTSFDLSGLHKCLSGLVSVSNESVLLDVKMYISMLKIKIKGNEIRGFFERMESIAMRDIFFTTSVLGYCDEEVVYTRISRILESLSKVAADKLVMKLPLGNLDFVKNVHCCLASNKRLKSVNLSLYEGKYVDSFNKKYIIKSQVGTFTTCYNMNNVKFDLVGMHECISKLAFFDNERVLLDVTIKVGIKDIIEGNEIVDVFERLKLIDIREMLIEMNTDSECSIDFVHERLSCILNSLSNVSADKLVMEILPFGKVDFVKKVYRCLNSNRLLKKVDILFLGNYLVRRSSLLRHQTSASGYFHDLKYFELKITAEVGHFRVRYMRNNMNFDFEGLHECLSTLASNDDNRVFVDVHMNVDIRDIKAVKAVTDLFQRLQAITVRQILYHVKSPTCWGMCSVHSYNFLMFKSLPNFYADELVMEGLPLNFNFVKNVHCSLNKNKRLKSVYMTFCDNFPSDTRCHLEINTKHQHFKGRYSTNNVNFDLVGFHQCLSKFAFDDNDKVLLDVSLDVDIEEIIEKNEIYDLFRKLELVDVRRISLKVTNSGGIDMEDLRSRLPSIRNRFPKVSTDKLAIEGWPQFGIH